MKYKAVLFDLDGTLINSLVDIVKSLNDAFHINGINTNFSYEETKNFIGSGAKVLIDRAYAGYGDDEETKKKVYDAYMAIYKDHCNDLTKPFDHVEETIRELKAKGVIVGVISNKPDRDAKNCVNHHFGDLFTFAEGGKDGVPLKPDPKVFDVLAKQYNLIKEDTLYVGDMIFDMKFANNVGMDIAICTFGYGKIKEMNQVNYFIDDLRDLIKIVEG